MLKKFTKILLYFFIFVFIIQIIGLLFLIIAPIEAQAAYTPSIDIGYNPSEGIGGYVAAIYKYAIGIVGILATVVMMFGGALWITAGGNAERIGNAKSWIGAALTGLVLALASYTILYTVNPNLVKFKPLNIDKSGENNIICCHSIYGDTSFEYIDEKSGTQTFTCTPRTNEEIKKYGKNKLPECQINQKCEYKDTSYICVTKKNCTRTDCNGVDCSKKSGGPWKCSWEKCMCVDTSEPVDIPS